MKPLITYEEYLTTIYLLLKENVTINNDKEINPCNLSKENNNKLQGLLSNLPDVHRLKCMCPCHRIIVKNWHDVDDAIKNEILALL
jgi:hypothetical protein